MAVLSDNDRAELHADFMATEPDIYATLTKQDIRDAVNALDDFLNDNAAAINNTLPLTARTELTTAQKARLLNWVIRWRYIKGA